MFPLHPVGPVGSRPCFGCWFGWAGSTGFFLTSTGDDNVAKDDWEIRYREDPAHKHAKQLLTAIAAAQPINNDIDIMVRRAFRIADAAQKEIDRRESNFAKTAPTGECPQNNC